MIYWTDFYQILFDRRLPIWLPFSDGSRVVAMATIFRVKIEKFGYVTSIRSPGIPK